MTNEEDTKTSFNQKTAKSQVSSVASDIKEAASQKFDETVSEVRSKADHTKSDVAGEVKGVADALRRASDEMRSGSAQERTLGQISSSLADASDQIRDKDFGEIVQMASKVARDNPILFLSGAALLGFAASRFAKATRDHQERFADRSFPEENSQASADVDEGNFNAQPMPAVPS